MIEGDAVERGDGALIGDCTRTWRSSFVTEDKGPVAESGSLGCSSRLGAGEPLADGSRNCSAWFRANDDIPTALVFWEPSPSSRAKDGDAREVEGSECCRFPLRAANLFASPSSRILFSVALMRSGCMPSGKLLSFGAISDISSSELDGGLGGSRESKVSGSCTRLAKTDELSVRIESSLEFSR